MTSKSILLQEILRAPKADAITVRILDAALEEYLAHGLRRTSVDDVARTAGLGRATIYRRFATRDELISAVLARECRKLFTEIGAATQALPTFADRLVEGFVVGLRASRRQPLLNRLLVSEPDLALPLLTVRGGPVLATLRECLVRQYRASQDAIHGIPAARLEEVAEILVRLAISLVLTTESCLALDTDEQVRSTARRYLVPLVTGGPAVPMAR